MLRIYYGNEATNKETFILNHIDPSKKTILIVPDQYSLQMERDALAHFRDTGPALINFMVTDFSSLGYKVVQASRSKNPELIDKYGRHMLLALIIDKVSEELSVYRKMKGRNSFISLMNSLISEMKRYGTTPEDLAEVTEAGEGVANSYLEFKLQDIEKIYQEYEAAVEDKFLDSEDYIRFYGELILDAELVSGADIWVYGFDTFTPLNLLIMQRLLQVSDDLNVVMTCEYDGDGMPQPPMDARRLTIGEGEGLFDLSKYVIKQLSDMADEIGEAVSISPVTEIRTSAFAKQVALAETSNIYAEAEKAASYILTLVRDEGYQFGDIALICNDIEVRGKILERTFHRWGIPCFADQKRRVLHQPVVKFLLSLMDVMVKGFVNEYIMSMIKTGLLGWNGEDEELLQNYVTEFKIRGGKWKTEFTRTGGKYSEAQMQRLNEMRGEIVDIVQTSRDETGRRNTAEEKVRGIYEYLESRFKIRDRIAELMEQQQDLGLLTSAAETAQSWNLICSLFTQIVRVIGNRKISNEGLRNLISAGLEEAEIGLVPQSSDCVLIGTMQRTRMSRIKVLMVIGANEGVLPMKSSESGLLTDKELGILENLKVNISKREEISRQEEQLAIYRNLSLPTDILYVSYSLSDADGRSSAPSFLFNDLKNLFHIKPAGDLGSENEMELISSKKGTLPYMAGAMRDYAESSKISDEWIQAMRWYGEHDRRDFDLVAGGLLFSNRLESIGQELADALYCGDSDKMFVSASRLERYSECPFKHFIDQGLRADEQRIFEIGGREIGDIYHDCLMKLSQELTPQGGTAVTADESPWMCITRQDCDELVRKIILEEADHYREGIFASDSEGCFRRDWIISICSDVAWALVRQVRGSKIRAMRFEEPFGYSGSMLPPIRVQLSSGKEAVLRGKIDRLDVLDTPDNYAVGIVDYKSGNNKIDTDKIRSGYKLQLMVYMNAARQRKKGVPQPEPAGVFYFKIKDRMIDVVRNSETEEEKLNGKLKTAFTMEGITLRDENLYDAFDTEFYEEAQNIASCESNTIPVKFVKSKKEYAAKGGSELLSEGDFEELCDEAGKQVERICQEIYSGNIAIAPKREKDKGSDNKRITACRYCGYKSICMFDTSFDGCRYTEV